MLDWKTAASGNTYTRCQDLICSIGPHKSTDGAYHLQVFVTLPIESVEAAQELGESILDCLQDAGLTQLRDEAFVITDH